MSFFHMYRSLCHACRSLFHICRSLSLIYTFLFHVCKCRYLICRSLFLIYTFLFHTCKCCYLKCRSLISRSRICMSPFPHTQRMSHVGLFSTSVGLFPLCIRFFSTYVNVVISCVGLLYLGLVYVCLLFHRRVCGHVQGGEDS